MMIKKITLVVLLLLVATRSTAYCPHGWDEFDNSCYKVMTSFLYSVKLNWESARAVCLGLEGDLLSIKDQREMEFTTSLMSVAKVNNVWIGLNDRLVEGQFVWSDGTPFNSSVYNNWNDREPNGAGYEDCVELEGSRWIDRACHSNRHYICERPKGKLSCPVGWFLNGSSCYKVSERSKKWINAKQDCHASGGYLAKIDDASEQHFIEVYFRITGGVQLDDFVWIGLNDIEQKGTFTWEVDNSSVNFTKWGSNQPDNYANVQHCIAVGAKSSFGFWFDDRCSISRFYICEKPAKAIEDHVPAQEAATQENVISNIKTAYISFGVAFILLLLFFMVAFWRYKKSVRSRMESSTRSRREIIPLDKWEILPDQVEYEEELGRGAFGVVYKAILKPKPGIEVFDNIEGLETKKANQVVAVKELQDDPSEVQKEEFLFEIAMMKLLGAHQNIVSLVGCCTLQEHKFLVIEYVPFGDLLQWLRRKRSTIKPNGDTGRQTEEKFYEDKGDIEGRQRKHGQEKRVLQVKDRYSTDPGLLKLGSTLHNGGEIILSSGSQDSSKNSHDHENIELSAMPSTSQEHDQTAENLISTENIDDENKEDEGFTTQQLFSFAWQIARGMNHLADKDFVHRDLAARNILVGHDNRVKVSDFGLMSQIYEDVYSAKKTKKLPVKWMAPESIQDGVFTIKSDVWSYGIVLWEMATMGGVPYPTMSNAEMGRAVKKGYRMERPEMCCDEAYELMTECWREDPTARPSFLQLIDRLETIMTTDVAYCDLSKHDESSPYYSVLPKDTEDSG